MGISSKFGNLWILVNNLPQSTANRFSDLVDGVLLIYAKFISFSTKHLAGFNFDIDLFPNTPF